MIERYDIESREDWREWVKKIPALKFDADWEVKIIPPFGGAMGRFLVSKNGGHSVSVYLDCHDALGYMEQPYWEAYPIGEDTARFLLDDTEGLINAIRTQLEAQ